MKEDYLQYVWKFQLFNSLHLLTTEGEKIEPIKTGNHNFNSGPDFLEARVKIGNEVWCGSVEIHTKTSDWNKHKHQLDKAYNNVILHVVYQHDKDICNHYGDRIPVLEMKEILIENHYKNYKNLINSKSWVACSSQIMEVDNWLLHNWMDRLVLNRIERKTTEILNELEGVNGDWKEVTHRFLFRHFGMKTNSNAMLELARRVPLQLVRKEENIEALLFGQSGMLNHCKEDEYVSSLQVEYSYIRNKRNLVPLENSNWKFFRLHPSNFPTIRIAQLALLYKNNDRNIFERIRNKTGIATYENMFNLSMGKYWEHHYVFGKESRRVKNKLGNSLLNNVLINVIVPICFAYGKYIGDDSYVEFSMKLLRSVKKENNKIVRNWKSLNVKVENAYDSQAVLELYNEYCIFKKCVSCQIGNQILTS